MTFLYLQPPIPLDPLCGLLDIPGCSRFPGEIRFMAAVFELPEATSTKEVVLGLLLVTLPMLAGGLALKFRARRTERMERSLEEELRVYILDQGGTIVERGVPE